MANKIVKGFTDEAAYKDLFDVQSYVDGLVKFIKNCVTPMTVSIQGDWGSGKTSMMNMIRQELGESVFSIWFNTWQYSQFNLGDDLALSFLGALMKDLKVKDDVKEEARNKALSCLYKTVKSAGRIAIDKLTTGEVLNQLDLLAEKFANGEDDVAKAVNDLKEDFKKKVKRKIDSDPNKDRVVIFVDDLDRLNPGKAVELLEILKLFLDCENCVFVLAIDYSVVTQGVKEKYGDLIGEDKGKNFFDKIIQVPFKMPVAHYKLDKFIVNMFETVGIDLSEDGAANEYISLIQTSVGCNPRTMKRLFNAYLLLTYISENNQIKELLNDSEKGNWYKKMLFAILCCQHAYEELYNYLVRNSSDITIERLEELKMFDSYRQTDDGLEENDHKSPTWLVDTFRKAPDEIIYKMITFMDKLITIIDRDGSNGLDDEELNGFRDLLQLTTITSAGNTEEAGQNKEEKELQKKTRDIIKTSELLLKQNMSLISDKIEHVKIYQSEKNTKSLYYPSGQYMACWADLWMYLVEPEYGKVGFESVLMTDIDTKKIDLYMFFRVPKGIDKDTFSEYMSNHNITDQHGYKLSEDKKRLYKIVNDIGVVSDNDEQNEEIGQKIYSLMEEQLKLYFGQ